MRPQTVAGARRHPLRRAEARRPRRRRLVGRAAATGSDWLGLGRAARAGADWLGRPADPKLSTATRLRAVSATTGSGGTGLHLHLEFTSPGATIEFARVLDVEYRPGGLGAKPQNGSPTKPAPCPIESGQPRLAAPTHRSRWRGARRPWKISGVLLHSSAHKTYRRQRRVASTRFNIMRTGGLAGCLVSRVFFSKIKTYAATQARTQSTTRTHWSPSTGFTRCARARPGPMPAAPMATRSPI